MGDTRRCRITIFKPDYHRVPRQCKTEPRANLCYFLNFCYNHGRNCSKLSDVEIGKKIVFSCDVTLYHPEAPLILPATAVGNQLAVPPEDIYVPIPTPVAIVATPSSAPATAPTHAPAPAPSAMPAPASVPTSATITPSPLTMSKFPVPIPPCVGRNCNTRDMRRCSGGLLAKSIHMLTATTDYCRRWTMKLWCPCWRQ